MSNRMKYTLLMTALIIGILLHVAYMCYLRQDFAVGGEWFVYALAAAYVIYEGATEND